MQPEHPTRSEALPENPIPVGAGIQSERKAAIQRILEQAFATRCRELTEQGKAVIPPKFRDLHERFTDPLEREFAFFSLNSLIVERNSEKRMSTTPASPLPKPLFPSNGDAVDPTEVRGNAYWKAKQGIPKTLRHPGPGVRKRNDTRFSD